MLGTLRDELLDLEQAAGLVGDCLGVRDGRWTARRPSRGRRPSGARRAESRRGSARRLVAAACMERDLLDPAVELGRRRQLAEEEQIRHLEERPVLGQLLDRVAPVAQDALVAVDEGDAAPARRRVLERRVVGHQAEVGLGGLDLPQVHGADGAVLDGDLVLLARAVVGDCQGVGHRSRGRLRQESGIWSPGPSGDSSRPSRRFVGRDGTRIAGWRRQAHTVRPGEPAAQVGHLAALAAERPPPGFDRPPAAMDAQRRIGHRGILQVSGEKPRTAPSATPHAPATPAAGGGSGRAGSGRPRRLAVLFLVVADVPRRDHEDDVLGDVGRVVADPLEVPGDQDEVQRRLDDLGVARA